MAGSIDSARCAGIHVASRPSSHGQHGSSQHQRIARSGLMHDGSQQVAREDCEHGTLGDSIEKLQNLRMIR